MKKVICIALIAVLSACSVKLLVPTQADVNRVSTKYPGYTIEELSMGKSIFETNCKGCHGLKNPSSRSEDKWKEIVPKMVRKLNKEAGKEVMDSKQQETLLKYLITMSTAPKAK